MNIARIIYPVIETIQRRLLIMAYPSQNILVRPASVSDTLVMAENHEELHISTQITTVGRYGVCVTKCRCKVCSMKGGDSKTTDEN